MKKQILITLVTLLFAAAANAQIPRYLTYQGVAVQNNTQVNTNQNVTVRIYYDQQSTTSAYEQVLPQVVFSNGYFGLMLGPLPDNVDFSKPLYMGISIGGAPELTPRAMVTPTPYSFYAANSGNANQAFHALSADTAQYAVIADTARNIDASHNNAVLNINGQSQNVILHYYDNITSVDSSLAITTSGGSPLKEADLSVKSVASTKLTPPTGIKDGQTIQWSAASNQWVPASMNDPVGTVIAYAGATIDTSTGWMICDGDSLLTTSYTPLFNVVGNSFPGSSYFHVPDYRGLFLRGVNTSPFRGNRTDSYADPDATTLRVAINGGNPGNKVGSVEADAFMSHSHTYDGPSANSTNANFTYGQLASQVYNCPTATTNSAGGNETRPKNAYVNWIIKTRP